MMIAWFLGATTALKVTVISVALCFGSVAVVVPLAVSATQAPHGVTGGDPHTSDPNSPSPSDSATPSAPTSTTPDSSATGVPDSGVPIVVPQPTSAPLAPTSIPEIPSSTPTPSFPEAAAPSAPVGLSLASVSGNWAEVSWAEPLTPGSQPVTGYALFASVDDGAHWHQAGTVSAGQLSFRFAGLQQDTTYLFAARAVSNAGTSDFSNSVEHSTTFFAPDAPIGLQMGSRGCDTSGCGGAVSFVPPANPGSTTLTYEVGFSVDAGSTWQFVEAEPDPAASNYFTFTTPPWTTDLQDSLTIAVRATNENGTSPLSVAVSFR